MYFLGIFLIGIGASTYDEIPTQQFGTMLIIWGIGCIVYVIGCKIEE